MYIKLFSLFFISTLLFAEDMDKPLLALRKGTGYTLPEYSQSLNCQVFEYASIPGDKYLSINRKIGPLVFNHAENVRGLLSDYKKLIAQAAKGKINKTPGPIDGPTTEYLAYHQDQPIVLFRDGMGENMENGDAASQTLRNVLDYLCENKSVH